MTKKALFKRILKIFGLVFLGAVLLVGGVIGVMAIRGDFKKKTIEPTEVNFEIDKVNLEYNVGADNDDNIYSFVVRAQPEDVTELECALKVSEPSLITFKTKKDGVWVDYTSNVFYLNRPIYFSLNNVTEENVNAYNDGVITITVEAGYVKSDVEINVDRNVTSISFVDQSDDANNKISNGLFAYEYVADDEGQIVAKYDGKQEQHLEAVIGQAYDLEVVTAPLKALKPFDARLAKEYEIYYVDSNEFKLLTHDKSTVKLQTFTDGGGVSVQNCSFLTYDEARGIYVFNSSSSGQYEFRLAVYPTYAKQEEIKADSQLSVYDKLGAMLTKKVIISVTGTDAQYIEFNNGQDNILMNLLDNNEFVLNNPNVEDVQNLGLVLSKKGSGTEITGRFNELSFLDTSAFRNSLIWKFYLMQEEEGELSKKYVKTNTMVEINFFNNSSGKKRAQISGLADIPDGAEFDVTLKKGADGYVLNFATKIVQAEEEVSVSLSLNLTADSQTGKTLNPLADSNDMITMRKDDTTDIYLSFNSGDTMILGDKFEGEDSSFDFKTLKQGLYLVFLGALAQSGELYTNINDRFQINISRNEADSRITIVPKDGAMDKLTIDMYGIVVNADGSMAYTAMPISITINKKASTIELIKPEVVFPVVINGGTITYGDELDVESLVRVSDGSYKEVLLFAPKFEYILLTDKPADWGTAEYYTYDSKTKTYSVANNAEWSINKYYKKVVNNYKFIEGVYYLKNSVRYYLLGYVGVDGKFINKVVATGENSGSRLYPFIPQTDYLAEYGRNQTAEEYVDALLSNAMSGIVRVTGDATNIRYDTSLVENGKLFVISGFVSATNKYDANAEYYKLDSNGNYVATIVPSADRTDWENKYTDYYIVKPEYIKTSLITGFKYTASLTYYTQERGDYVEADQVTADNVSEYYIKADYYLISSVNNDGVGSINVSAKLCSNGKIFDYTISVTIGQDDNNSIQVVNANGDSWDTSKYVTVDNFYDFDNSTLDIGVQFGGTYYENSDNTNGDKHYIIVDHKNINMTWDGSESDGGNAISKKIANISLTMDNGEILNNIKNNLQLKTYEYDSNNQFLEDNIMAIEIANNFELESAKYIQATGMYNKNETYYTKQNTEYKKVDEMPQSDVENWASNYTKYYVASPSSITVEFSANKTLDAGDYIKFVWIYTVGDREYKIFSGPLYIQTRDVSGYSVSLPEVAYQAVKLTSDSYTGDFYQFNGGRYEKVTDKAYDKNGNYFKLIDYVLETAENVDNWAVASTNYYTYSAQTGYQPVNAGEAYVPGKFYKLDNLKYTGEISYKILVGYDVAAGDYTYTAYAIDINGNYLFSKIQDGELVYSSISTDINNAFALGGWIKVEPFYAVNTELEVQTGECLELKDGKLVVKSIKNGSTSVTLKNRNNSAIGLQISTYIEQDGKFKFAESGYQSKSSSVKKIDIGNGYLKYNTTPIDNMLDVDVSEISIKKNNKDVTSNYVYAKNGKIITYTNSTDSEDVITIKYSSGWEVTRTKFVDVDMKLTFSCVLGSKDCNVKFTNPYTISRSTNSTEIIYSGTTFILAEKGETATKGALYLLTLGSGAEGSIDVYVYTKVSGATYTRNTYYKYDSETDKYSLVKSGTAPKDWNTGDYYSRNVINVEDALVKYLVPSVSDKVETHFEIQFTLDTTTEIVDTFALTIAPNSIVRGDTSNIHLDDYNTSYDVSNIEIKKFKEMEYAKYDLDDETKLEDVADNIDIEFETYTDSKYTNKYSTNVVKYDTDNKKIVADLISEKGVYYVKGWIKVGGIVAGEIQFDVTTKSEVRGENGEVDSLDIVAKVAKTYTLAELQTMFNLERAGEMYTSTTDYDAGKTYELVNGKYVLLQEEKDTKYYKKYNLTDIFYIDYSNPNLQITYTYNGTMLVQKCNIEYIEYSGEFVEGEQYYYKDNNTYVLAESKVTGTTYYIKKAYSVVVYDDVEYTMVGTTCNFVGLTYDMATGKVKNSANEDVEYTEVDNNIIKVNNGGGLSDAYYCKQNALIFKSADNLLIISQNNGKKLYITNLAEPIDLGDLQSITLEYCAFGENISNGVVQDVSTGLVAEISYSIIPVFDVVDGGSCIKTNDTYMIRVKPYTVQASVEKIVGEREYVLTDLFKTSEDTIISTITFGSGDGYSISNDEKISAEENGNNGEINIPITLKYNNGSSYSYNGKLIVLNEIVVGINYPFSISDADNAGYSVFNANVDELTNGINGLAYDLTDLGIWLGEDTSNSDWEQSAKMKFDILLPGDTVDLTKNSIVTRFETFKRIEGTAFNTSQTYYTYNRITQAYEAYSGGYPVDFGEITYFTKVEAEIADIELVAVSSTLANTLPNVIDNVVFNNGKITIGEDFNYTGYLAFKVHIKNSTAYGYYIAKVVDDANFARTIDTINGRYSATISKKIESNATMSMMELIENADTSISTLGRFDASLIAEGYSNIYLFMMSNKDNAGNPVSLMVNGTPTEIANGGLIDWNAELSAGFNAKTLKVAVVIKTNSTSLVYIGNYEINILSLVEVTKAANVDVIDSIHNVYECELEYSYTANNTTAITSLITNVSAGDDELTLNSVELNAERTSPINKGISASGKNVQYEKVTFAQINGTNLVLTNGVSQTMSFYLTLKYNMAGNAEDAIVYLLIHIKPIELTSNSNRIELGKWDDDNKKFNTSLDLKNIFNDYTGNYTLSYSTDNSNWITFSENNDTISKEGNIITITATTTTKIVYIKLTLTEVVPQLVSNTYTLLCYPSILTEFTSDAGDKTRLMVEANENFKSAGSELKAIMSKDGDVYTIEIYNGENKIVETITASRTRIVFTLTDNGVDASGYFDSSSVTVNNNSVVRNFSSGEFTLPFIHLPSDKDLILTMTIYPTAATSYSGISMLITLPKTYELKTGYRVSDYQALSSKPDDWSTNYNDYYTLIAGEYVKNNEDAVPTFDTDKYYKRVNPDYETVIENTALALSDYTKLTEKPADWDTSYNNYYTLDSGAYVKNNEASVPAFDEKVYYTHDISTNFFGYTNNSGYQQVNTNRVYILWNGVEKSFEDSYANIGLLDRNNLNYLLNDNRIYVGTTLASGGASVENGTLKFGNAGDEATLKVSNILGAEISYKFVVYTQDADLATFTFADLLVVNDEYVSVGRYDLQDPEGNVNENFTLGYLRYYPTDTNFAWVKTSDENNISFTINQNAGGGVNAGAIQLSNIIAGGSYTITIITVDGIAKQFDFIAMVSNVDYGYSGTYEELYAGTEGYKLTDNTSTGKARVNLIMTSFNKLTEEPSGWDTNYNIYYTYNATTRRFVKNNFDSAPDFNSGTYYKARSSAANVIENKYYSLEYKGSVNGHISYWGYDAEVDYSANDTSLVIWDDTNKTFATRAVNHSKNLTLIFDITYTKTGNVYSGKIVTRIYYPIQLINNINIGVNKQVENEQVIDLYLGSEAYESKTNTTTIDLMVSQDSTPNYNNLFVTLEQYPNYTISAGSALYNGTENEEQHTQSVYDPSNVSQYLKFSVSNLSAELEGKVEVDDKGKLSIIGNPSGTFTLNVYSTNGTGYGKSFDIQVHPYYKVTAKYNDSIAVDVGNKKTGETVNLINIEALEKTNFAFNVQRSGVASLAGDEELMAGASSAIEVAQIISDNGTSIDDIKNKAEEDWTKITRITYTDGECKYTIPAVPYSSTAGETTYYIVSVRIGVLYNGQTTYYYAHYRVSNTAYIEVNEYYIDNNKTVKYKDKSGCWTEGSALTLMDADGKGMYNSLVPLTSQPTDWEANYKNYYQYTYTAHNKSGESFVPYKYWDYDEDTKEYTIIKSEDEWKAITKFTVYTREAGIVSETGETPKFVAGQYFTINDVVGKLNTAQVQVYIKSDTIIKETVVTTVGSNATVTLALPNNLFTNSGTVTIIFKDLSIGTYLLQDEWTFKSDNEIEPKSTKRLNDFFLLSEIGNQQYYDTPIVGIMSSWDETTAQGFVDNASSAALIPDSITKNDYVWISSDEMVKLCKVRYTGSSGGMVFTTTYDAYVLVGKARLMQINFNGGNYYINYTVDDNSNWDKFNDFVSVDVKDYITIWEMETDKDEQNYGEFKTSTGYTLTVNGTGISFVTLSDVSSYTSGQSVSIEITAAGVTRKVELYFNIIITAKALNESYQMSYDSKVGNAMGNKTTLTADEVNNNDTLKSALLEKIKFNGLVIDKIDYDKFTITITKDTANNCYNIVYTYKDAVVSYTRTIKMSLEQTT